MTAAEFKAIRINAKLSQSKLGELLSMSSRQIRRLEKGSAIKPLIADEMRRIAKRKHNNTSS